MGTTCLAGPHRGNDHRYKKYYWRGNPQAVVQPVILQETLEWHQFIRRIPQIMLTQGPFASLASLNRPMQPPLPTKVNYGPCKIV